MSFVLRAQKSRERGDTVRALLTLVAGLRREPDRVDAFDMLVELVRDEVDSPGIEHEIAQVLTRHPDRDRVFSDMVAGLTRRGAERIAERLRTEGEQRGFVYTPPPEPEPGPESEPEPELGDAESSDTPEDGEAGGSGAPAAGEPSAGESDDQASEAPEADDLPAGSDAETPEAAGPERETADVAESDPTDEEAETEDPEAAVDAAAVAAAKSRAREKVEEGRRTRRAKRRRRVLATVVLGGLIGLGAIGYYASLTSNRAAELGEVDGRIATFDTFTTQLNAFDAETPSTRPEVRERIIYGRALAGGDVEKAAYETAWGHGALALVAVRSADVEEAIERTTRVERMFPNTTPGAWARASLEERRGNFAEAREAAQRVIDRTPEFTPAHELIARVAARQLEFDELRAVVARLVEISPGHPYQAVLALRTPAEVLLGLRSEASSPSDDHLDVEAADDFLAAVADYRVSVSKDSGRDPEAVAAAARAAIEHDPAFAAARLVLGVALAAQGDPEGAARTFEEAASSGASDSANVRALIQAAAPLALTGAGRPDLARRFTTPFPKLRPRGAEDRFDEEVGETRPTRLRKSAIRDANVVPAAVDALFSRGEVLRAEGRYAEAVAMLHELDRRGIEPARARSMAKLIRLETTAGDEWDPEVENETARRVTAVAQDFRAGRFRSVADAPLDQLPAWAASALERPRILAMLALGRVDDATTAIERSATGLALRPSLQGLRLRALARTRDGDDAYRKLHAELIAAQPRSIERLLDLAAASFWQRNWKQTDEWLEAVARLDRSNREAAWICWMTATGRERADDAAECAEKSGRSPGSSAGTLLALAQLHELQRHPKEARATLEAAFALDPSDLDVVAALGESYAGQSRSAATADLERLLAGFERDTANAAARGELLKWLAIAKGSREGAEEAHPDLQQAAEILGERGDLVYEQARYWQSREDWERARTLYARALEQDASLTSAHAQLAKIALERRDTAAARGHLEAYLAAQPNGGESDWARRKLESLE